MGVCLSELLLCAIVSRKVLEQVPSRLLKTDYYKDSFSPPKFLTCIKDVVAIVLMKPRDVKLRAFQTDCSVQFHKA